MATRIDSSIGGAPAPSVDDFPEPQHGIPKRALAARTAAPLPVGQAADGTRAVSGAHLQYILNRLPLGMVMLDREYRVLSYSSVVADVLGAERMKRTLGHPIDAMHSVHAEGKIRWLLQQLDDESNSHFGSMMINVPDTILQLRVVRLRDAEGVSGYCVVLYDITELASQPSPPPQDTGDAAGLRQLLKLPVSTQGYIALLDIDRVAFLRAEGHYTQVFADGKYLFCTMALSQLESRLPPDKFLRVHRSYLVNLDYATKIVRRDDQYVISVTGSDDEKVPVSRGHVARLREVLGV